MKKMIFLFIGVAMVLYGVSSLPNASAYMVHKTETFSNQLIPGVVEVQVIEGFEDSVKSSIVVENTGNVDVYIRVRLVGHWEDTKGYPVGIDFDMPEISYNSTYWYSDSDDPYTYYYRTVVSATDAQDVTENLLVASISMEKRTGEYNGVTYEYYPVIEVFAEAIQAEGTTDANSNVYAVEDAWGVTLTDEKITDVN